MTHDLTERPAARSGTAQEHVARDPGMSTLSGRPLAAVILGWSLLRVLLRQLVTRQEPGLARFHQNYGSEGLRAISQADRDGLDGLDACIACARCNFGEAARIAASNGEYPGLMQLVLASTRSMPDFDAAALGFAHVPDEVLRRKRARCPVGVPFFELAEFVRAKATPTPAGGV